MSTKIITPDTRGGIEGNELSNSELTSVDSVSQAFAHIVAQLQGSVWEATQETVSGVPCAVLVRRVRRSVEAASEPSETAPTVFDASLGGFLYIVSEGDSEALADPLVCADRPVYSVDVLAVLAFRFLSESDTVFENGVTESSKFCPLTSGFTFKTKSPMGKGVCLDGSQDKPESAQTRFAGGVSSESASVRFGDLASVKAMSSGQSAPVIGYDSEFTYASDGSRTIDSYQFACLDPHDRLYRFDIVLLPLVSDRVAVEDAIAIVLRESGLWETLGLPDWRGVPHRSFWDGSKSRRENLDCLFHLWRVSLVLAGHALKADAGAFRRPRSSRYGDLLLRLTSAAGGLVTLKPARFTRCEGTGSSKRWLPLSLTVRDTMTQAAPGSKSLAALGLACGVPKLDVGDAIENMSEYRRAHLQDFLEYAATDSVVVLEYLASLWGENSIPPVTLSGGGARAMRAAAKQYWWRGVDMPNSAFSLRFQGLVPVEKDVETTDDQLSYYRVRGMTPVDGDANQALSAFKGAYHGGWNSCLSVGYFDEKPTFDWDILSAYPSAMAVVIDPDFESGVIEKVIKDRVLSESDFTRGFATPLVAFCSWEFPEGVEPCLPVVIGQSVVYLRTSEGLGSGSDKALSSLGVKSFSGAWLCAPELLLALKLGAKVHVQIGYRLRILEHDGGSSRALRVGVKQLVEDRGLAKRIWGKKSLQEQTLKVATNSIYGKAAQDVSEQRGWNAWAQEMESVGGSAISSPYHAAMTTSLVRALLLAMANELPAGSFLSVTTDGFISTQSDVESFECYGLASVFREAREALVGDPTIWEVKHHQNGFLNLTTRGNVALESGGVFAKAGLKAPAGLSDAEARQWFFDTALHREGKVPNKYKSFTSFRELSREEGRVDFRASEKCPMVSLDFDLKRRPMEPVTQSVAGAEIARFDTVAWDNADDYRRGRSIAQHIANHKPGSPNETGCLKTVDDWSIWRARFGAVDGRRIRSVGSAFLAQLACAYKSGLVEIPQLDALPTVAEKLEWLSGLGFGEITRARWDSYSREDRRKRVLSNTDWMELNWFLEDLQAAA